MLIKLQKSLPQSNSETIKTEHGKEILKERYISPGERENYWWTEINIRV